MQFVLAIRVYQNGRKSWVVEREHAEGYVNLFTFPEQDKAQAVKTGQRYADYHNADLVVQGHKVKFDRSCDPKTFCGITRPA